MTIHPWYKKFKKTIKSWRKKKFFQILIVFLIVTFIFFGALASYTIAYKDKIYPNISIVGVGIGGKTQGDSLLTLSSVVATPQLLTLKYQDQTFDIKPDDIDMSFDLTSSVQQAYSLTRIGNFASDMFKRLKLLFVKENFDLVTNINEEKLDKILSVISGQISVEPVEPSMNLVKNEIVIDIGKAGKEVNQEKLKELIKNTISTNSYNTSTYIEIPVDIIDLTLTESEVQSYKEQGERFVGKTLYMKFEFETFSLDTNDIFDFVDPLVKFKNDKISEYVDGVAKDINRSPQNPKFTFANGRVTEFLPALDGIELKNEELANLIEDSLEKLSLSEDKTITIEIPITKTPPGVTTDKVNDMGIRELIGRGTSTYYHSIPSRVHNVVLAASKINGTLVAPGETFSFNQTLGDVSEFTGYQQAYIISEGKTILGDGGGVCQVSTTLFRSLLNAGLPINERRAHAYRVGYYEQGSPPGLDATVYSPSPDLKFTNDTPSHILIVATANPKNYSLIFELYGTSDERVATISKPVVTNVVAPPEDLYQDDPTLPMGVVKQIDYKAWGAKVTFSYTVKRGGETIISKVFTSNYRPWQAIYLRGTGPAQ